MRPKLLLYFDTNIIVPVSCDAGGHTHETEPIYYSAIPDSSHIEIICDFYKKTTGVNTIDTHFVFAEIMETSFKKRVIQNFSKEGFIPMSFTIIPSLVLTEYALKQVADKSGLFGENVMILYSNDDSLRVTGTIYDGNRWQWNVNNEIIPKVGNSPLKRSLIESLINERDKRLGAIDARNREREIEYQMQFADKWLAIYKDLDSRDDLTIDFKFSFEDANVKLRVPKKKIEQLYEQAVSQAISSITDYKEREYNNSIKYAILVGPAFEEENFTSKIRAVLGCHEQFSIIPYTRLSLILAQYLEKCDNADDFEKFDQISNENDRLYKNNIEWIQHAQSLIEFNELLNIELQDLSKLVKDDANACDAIISTANACLEKSAFDEAKNVLGKTLFPSIGVCNSVQKAMQFLAKKENMEGIFTKMERVDGARQLIKRIQDNSEKLRATIATSESHQAAIIQKATMIDFYEAHYNEYLDLKREFNKAPDYKTKKEFLLKMEMVTMEPLPKLKLPQVIAEIICSKEKVKIGLFKKKNILHVTITVKDGDVLPCNAILNISNKAQIRASEGGADSKAYKINKGETSFSIDIESPDKQIDFTKPIYCYLFVDRDVLDKSAIKCEHVIIK